MLDNNIGGNIKMAVAAWELKYDYGGNTFQKIHKYLSEKGTLAVHRLVSSEDYVYHFKDSTVLVETNDDIKPQLYVKVWSSAEQKSKQVLDDIITVATTVLMKSE